jgi:hypothetical protein
MYRWNCVIEYTIKFKYSFKDPKILHRLKYRISPNTRSGRRKFYKTQAVFRDEDMTLIAEYELRISRKQPPIGETTERK